MFEGYFGRRRRKTVIVAGLGCLAFFALLYRRESRSNR